MGRTRKRILVVDDQPVVGELLAACLQSLPGVAACESVADLAAAQRRVRHRTPDLVLAEFATVNGAGLRFLAEVRRHNPRTAVALFSSCEDPGYIRHCLQAGALGYISKREPVAHVTAAVRQLLTGRQYITARCIPDVAIDSVCFKKNLSAGERTVFDLTGRGLTTAAIAEHLGVTISTVETHRRRIKRKLGIVTHADFIRRATRYVEKGY